MLAHFSHATSKVVECYNAIIRFISVLLCARSPSAIAGFVVALVIGPSVDLQRWRTSPHICKERLERFSPTLTDRNVACSVRGEIGMLGVGTTLDHVAPRLISPRFHVALPVCLDSIAEALQAKASAGLCMFAPQFVVANRDNVATSAFANTGAVSAHQRACGKHSKIAKLLSNGVGSFLRHNGYRITVVASGGRPASTGAHCDCRINSVNVN